MARIKRITFEHTAKEDGCECDRCGACITNIVTVTFTDGLSLNYGQDCFQKLRDTGNLNAYGKKLLNKALEKIKYWANELERYKSGEINEENDSAWQCMQSDNPYLDRSYWYGRPYEEYRRWIIEEVIPQRFKEAQKEIDRFSKVEFKR